MIDSAIICFNELSRHERIVTIDEVYQSIDRMVDAIRRARARRPDLSLWLNDSWTTFQVAPGIFMASWATGARKDSYRLLLTLAAKRPANIPARLRADVDYQTNGQTAVGLGAAAEWGTLAFSLDHADWGNPALEVRRLVLSEAEGGPSLEETKLQVLNIATVAHVDMHAATLRTLGVQQLRDGTLLWARRGGLFPNLSFLPRVEDDLKALQPAHLAPVITQLLKLEESASEWEASAPIPLWRTHVTPEAEQRKRHCQFMGLNGHLEIFDLHARFTPGPGRIHFRLNGSTRSLVVAYVGRKIAS